ncbi:hypothetical protein [Microbispora hainanensis]|uniref:Uncharacterized protein n=1 Tax=Microbispora hainanensis TaxID=568844 RepID=A0A544Z3P7_9ACTN|nr:hypothetical protein [Microbispora hainanensis]TQS23679.1 hypothetical protein FLX08_04345 [Microbispora hainanensis]
MEPEHQADPITHVRVDHRLQSRTCAWCGTAVPYSGRGRPASYCSKSCRNRAWEVRTAEARLQRDIATGALRAEPVREVIRETVTRTQIITARPEPAAWPVVPTTAREWLAHLGALADQVREGELSRQHWHHVKLYNALLGVLVDLGEAYPGGMDYLQRDATRRKR